MKGGRERGVDAKNALANTETKAKQFFATNYLEVMATYVYETIPGNPKQKPRRFEVVQKMSEPALTKDPATGEPIKRIIIGGSGWITHGTSILSMNKSRKR